MKNDIIIFRNGELELEVTISEDRETVWLSANQMSALFDRDEKTIRKHINNVFKEKEVNKENNTQKMRVDGVKQPVLFYSLDVIISVGYRVKSQRGVDFRKWASSILKEYMIKGYSATIFLEFLNKNQRLIINGKQIISNSALVSITLMIAESKPKEKELMINLIMNFLD